MACSTRRPFSQTKMPAPNARNVASFSCTRTLRPRWRRAIAAASPAKPAPAISACIGGSTLPWLRGSGAELGAGGGARDLDLLGCHVGRNARKQRRAQIALARIGEHAQDGCAL